MKEEVKGYTLRMKESDGGTETISGSDIHIEYAADDSVEKLIKKQNPLLFGLQTPGSNRILNRL